MKNEQKKVKVEIFVPFGSCVCSYAPLMEKVGQVTLKFKDLVEVQTKSTKSQKAFQYGVQDVCVVVGDKKFSPDFDENELEEVIKKRVQD
jgi:hypothetical protein